MYPNNQQNNMYNQVPNGNMYYINQMQEQQPMQPVRQGKGAGPLPIVILLIIILLGVLVFLLIKENEKKDDSDTDKPAVKEPVKPDEPEKPEQPAEELLFRGTWTCDIDSTMSSDDNNKFVITFGENDFTWYSKSDPNILTVKGTYKLVKTQEKAEGTIASTNYTIEMTAKERVIDGERTDKEVVNEYELGIPKENTNTMAMINTNSYTLLYCAKS